MSFMLDESFMSQIRGFAFKSTSNRINLFLFILNTLLTLLASHLFHLKVGNTCLQYAEHYYFFPILRLTHEPVVSFESSITFIWSSKTNILVLFGTHILQLCLYVYLLRKSLVSEECHFFLYTFFDTSSKASCPFQIYIAYL